MAFTYNESFKASLEYFNGDDLAAKVFVDKYALRDNEQNLLEKTPRDMHLRIAKEIARIEKNKFKNPMSEEEIFSYLDEFKRIVPQGSPMYGIGNPYQFITISNCYVISSPADSYASIHKTDEELSQISKRRGGVGLDLSNLRPVGFPTKNAARTSTGILSFMERYSNSIREVGQGGRRGALMLTLSVHHPEVLNFAKIKKDLTKVTGANISIRLTDEFLNAVTEKKEYQQRFPVNSSNPVVSNWVDAVSVWKEIIDCAWNCAEPGLLFWDNIIKESPADCYKDFGFATESTNPCCFAVDKDVFVVTKNGIKEIKEIDSNDEIWIDFEKCWAKTSGYFKSGISEVYKVTFSNNEELTITPNHKLEKIATKSKFANRELVELKNLNVGDRIALSFNYLNDLEISGLGNYEEGLILGWLTGDGCLSYHDVDEIYPSLILDFWPQEFDVAQKINKIFSNYNYDCGIQKLKTNNKKRISSVKFTKDFVNKYQFNIWKFKTGFNDFLFKASKCFLKGYLSSYFSADGTVQLREERSSFNIQISSIDKKRLEQIKSLLLIFGIKSTLGKSRDDRFTEINKLIYKCQAEWRISITGFTNLKRFYDNIGFISDYKQNKLRKIIERFIKKGKIIKKELNYTKIKEIKCIGKKEVGCIKVEKYHKFTANGIISGNSELPLCFFDSCRLLLLNLYGYITNPFTKKACFDYNKFYKDCQVAQRFMDDFIDLELECIDKIIKKIESDPEDKETKEREYQLWHKIKEKCILGRRTGTGITALGDTLAALNLKYGSKESIEESEKIYKTLKLGCYRSSVDMAKELGSFPIWNYKLEKDNPFLNRIEEDDKQLYDDMKKYGRRNIALLTTAPAGSVSILTQTTSGIEPLFMMSYKRRKKINPNDENSKIDFVDQNGDSWQEFIVHHDKLKDWMKINKETCIEKSPYFNCCAEDLDWEKRVELQAKITKHTDHSLSSTINLPEDISAKKVAEIYENAWKQGCKGITIYRKNCRTGVLVEDVVKRGSKINKTMAPARPKELLCDIHQLKVKGEEYFVIVGLLDDEPYEIFAGKNDNFFNKNTELGKIIKIKRSHYKIINNTGEEVDNVSHHCSNEEEALSRMTSTALRHGADISFVVHQLDKVKGDMFGFAKSLARTLKKYIKDGTKIHGETCGNCGLESLQRQEGCISCKNCGWSKCC